MKQSKKQKRLNARIASYEKLMDKNRYTEGAFTRPGSFKKS